MIPAFFMQKQFVSYQHKAVYFKVGSITPKTNNVWIIFHGYGQLAEEFRSSFKVLETEENFMFYPQGLSKFYLKVVTKNIGSSWMTSLDRDTDIENYLSYLDAIYKSALKPFLNGKRVTILGFSQGGHTASRWIANSHIRYDHLILWGSSLAHEIGSREVECFFASGKNSIVLGDQDRFIDAKQMAITQKRYQRIGFEYQLIQYHGGHDIYPDVLQKLV